MISESTEATSARSVLRGAGTITAPITRGTNEKRPRLLGAVNLKLAPVERPGYFFFFGAAFFFAGAFFLVAFFIE
jgi:hypothetical protein